MKAWVTRYCLTRGILEVEVVRISEGFLYYKDPSGLNGVSMAATGNWEQTLEQALGAAEAARQRRILLVQRQLARLKKLEVRVTKVEAT